MQRRTNDTHETSVAGLPRWVARTFDWLWAAITGSKLGAGAFVLLVYVLPYGLVIAAFTAQIRSFGDFAVLGYAALAAAAFVGAQPAPTPGMGTAALILAGVMGAAGEPVLAGLLAAAAQTLGLAVGYGAGAAGLGPALTARLGKRESAARAIESAQDVIRRRGATAMLFLASIPNPLYAFSAVGAGSAGTPFRRFLATSFIGGAARFLVCAFLGDGIEKLV